MERQRLTVGTNVEGRSLAKLAGRPIGYGICGTTVSNTTSLPTDIGRLDVERTRSMRELGQLKARAAELHVKYPGEPYFTLTERHWYRAALDRAIAIAEDKQQRATQYVLACNEYINAMYALQEERDQARADRDRLSEQNTRFNTQIHDLKRANSAANQLIAEGADQLTKAHADVSRLYQLLYNEPGGLPDKEVVQHWLQDRQNALVELRQYAGGEDAS